MIKFIQLEPRCVLRTVLQACRLAFGPMALDLVYKYKISRFQNLLWQNPIFQKIKFSQNKIFPESHFHKIPFSHNLILTQSHLHTIAFSHNSISQNLIFPQSYFPQSHLPKIPISLLGGHKMLMNRQLGFFTKQGCTVHILAAHTAEI